MRICALQMRHTDIDFEQFDRLLKTFFFGLAVLAALCITTVG